MSVGSTWMTGIVMDWQIGPLTYVIQVHVPGGRRWKRHVDRLRDSDIPVTEPAATSTNLASDFQDNFQFSLQSPVASNTIAEPPKTAAVPPQFKITSTPNPPQASSTKDHSITESPCYPS